MLRASILLVLAVATVHADPVPLPAISADGRTVAVNYQISWDDPRGLVRFLDAKTSAVSRELAATSRKVEALLAAGHYRAMRLVPITIDNADVTTDPTSPLVLDLGIDDGASGAHLVRLTDRADKTLWQHRYPAAQLARPRGVSAPCTENELGATDAAWDEPTRTLYLVMEYGSPGSACTTFRVQHVEHVAAPAADSR